MGCGLPNNNPLSRLKAVKVKCCMKEENIKCNCKRVVLNFTKKAMLTKKNSFTISTLSDLSTGPRSNVIAVPPLDELSEEFTQEL